MEPYYHNAWSLEILGLSKVSQLNMAQLDNNYKLTLEMWMVHLTIAKFIELVLHISLYHFNANRPIVPHKELSVVIMARSVKNTLIICM